jgi:iron complex transport system substrate-binding protein
MSTRNNFIYSIFKKMQPVKQRNLTILLLALLLMSITPLTAQDVTECDEGFRLITHELGDTCVSENVQRVVTLELAMTESILTLGVQPVGVADIALYNATVKLPMHLSEDAVDVGSRREPNLEVIASLNPDLIIAASWRVGENYDELSAIAPTIAFVGSENLEVMGDYFTSIAIALNREAEAEQILADMEQHFAAAAAAVSDANLDPGFVLSQTWYEESVATFRLFTDNAMPVEILTRIGLENDWVGELNLDGFSVVGIEVLGEIEDTHFLFLTDPDSAPFYEESPLWNSLPFVEAGRAYRLNDDLWLFGGPISAMRFVDAVLEAMGVGAVAISNASAECDAGFHLFENENIVKPVCVTETAQRIVTLDPFYSLQMSVEMDLPVIASAAYSSDGGFPASLSAEAAAEIEVIGGFEAPNMEAITALNPDLIIGDAYFLSAQYDLFNEIAPTVLISSGDWKDWYRIIAAAAGVPERAETAFDEYNARIADLQARMPENVTVSFLRIVPDGFQLYREAPNAYAPIAVMSEAGITRPEFESGTDEESFARLDYEGLTHIEGDILLYVVGGSDDDGEQLEAETLDNPIWQALPAVRAGQAYRVDAGPWMSFGGLGSAHAVLDDLFRYVAGIDPQEVSPNPFLMDEVEATPEATATASE